MPHTVCDVGAKTKLYQLVAEQFAESTITSVQRKYFNESKGVYSSIQCVYCMC